MWRGGDICVSGEYCPEQTVVPNLCAARTYNDVNGSSVCSPCPSGFYSPTNTANAAYEELVLACPEGYYCPESTEYASQYPCPAVSFPSQGARTSLPAMPRLTLFAARARASGALWQSHHESGPGSMHCRSTRLVCQGDRCSFARRQVRGGLLLHWRCDVKDGMQWHRRRRVLPEWRSVLKGRLLSGGADLQAAMPAWTLLRQWEEHHGQVFVWILLHFGRVDAAAHTRV